MNQLRGKLVAVAQEPYSQRTFRSGCELRQQMEKRLWRAGGVLLLAQAL